ncbi:hypothetical protein LZ198_28330, partial [Myxococcus sp. K15C18031901]|nr:hypothetical protein [Myxococcus dinghuensis]
VSSTAGNSSASSPKEDHLGLVSPRSFPLSRSPFLADYTLIGTQPLTMGDLDRRMSSDERRRLLAATEVSIDAGLTSIAEDAIHWAMAFRPDDVELALLGLSQPLCAILRKLLLRKQWERFETAIELEAALRARLAELGPYTATDAVREVEQGLSDAGDAMEELNLMDDEGGFVPADWRAHRDDVETQPAANNEDELTTNPRPVRRWTSKLPTA